MKRSACSLVALGAFSFYSLYVGARIFAASGHARAGLEGAEKQEPRLLDLLAKLDAKDPDDREAAAKELAKREGEAIVPALRKRAGIERDFHVRLALHYALAFHGDRQALKVLAEALSQRGHLGFVYLHDVTGRDFEWEISDWKKWIEETSDSDFRKIVAERRVPAEEQNAGWDEFLAAVTCLQERGDRPAAARRFRWVADQYPRSTFGRQSKELSELLATMVQEDQAWKEPADNSKLTVEEQITYNVYKLREVTCYQIMQPGMCSVLEPFGQKEGTYNAAIELRKIGPPAVPRLTKLLEDRRPTRSVGYWRSFRRDRTVLRYQDAAIEILNELLPAAFYRESSTRAYFSNEFPEVRRHDCGHPALVHGKPGQVVYGADVAGRARSRHLPCLKAASQTRRGSGTEAEGGRGVTPHV